ncbi:MAG: uncharacterized protein KVP18_004832 [Porospora cf. gigantea A]|uniref:uncharacterized protein n=1 Tax=Porospora cf. gigantea A TaxID=2853593 RepID=UPI003559BD6B|nr:MAG: hypothetical protein KVP18_004832 [Porospora cf. gigantea A]
MVVNDKKLAYGKRLQDLVRNYPQILVVEADHVGSRQFANIRFALRGKATIVMGKNTMIRTVLRQMLDEIPEVQGLIDLMKLNVGLVFCHTSLNDVKDIIMEHKVPAPARQGVFAPCSVSIPEGPTGLDPSQTNFFQALGIATKILKSQIELLNTIQFIKEGEKVTASQAVLLQKLNIRPFSYGLQVRTVYDQGQTYSAKVLDLTDDDVVGKFMTGVTKVAAFSRAIGHPTKASVPHSLIEAFKMMAALCLDIDYCFPEMQKLKEFVENPDAFAVAGPATTAAAAVVEEEPEEEEESDDDMGFSLFD